MPHTFWVKIDNERLYEYFGFNNEIPFLRLMMFYDNFVVFFVFVFCFFSKCGTSGRRNDLVAGEHYR